MLGLLTPIAGLLGLELDDLGKRARGLAIAYALIFGFALIGAGFLVAAGFVALSALYGALTATLVMAAGFLSLSLIVYIGMSVAENSRRKRVSERRRASDSGAFLTTAALTALPLLARSPALIKLGIPAAAIAALVLLRDKDTRED